MIWKILSAVAFALSVAIGSYLYVNQQRYAYVDVSVLMKDAKIMQDLKKDVEAYKLKERSRLDTLLIDFQDEMRNYNKNISNMTSKEKNMSKELIEYRKKEVMNFESAIVQNVKSYESKKTKVVVDAINKYISEYGKYKNYTMIFATSNGSILYANESTNITNEIIKGLNEK